MRSSMDGVSRFITYVCTSNPAECTVAKVALNHGYHLVLPLHHRPPKISSIRSLSPSNYQSSPSHLSRVVVLNPPLAVSVHKAGAALVALSGATTADTRRAVTTKHAAKAEQDSSEEEACERSPGKSEQVASNASILSRGAEGVTALDNPGTSIN